AHSPYYFFAQFCNLIITSYTIISQLQFYYYFSILFPLLIHINRFSSFILIFQHTLHLLRCFYEYDSTETTNEASIESIHAFNHYRS
ncbi:hypothetical protein PMAYCL1PPCAC_19075, partial [Pristionchus mayeri]